MKIVLGTIMLLVGGIGTLAALLGGYGIAFEEDDLPSADRGAALIGVAFVATVSLGLGLAGFALVRANARRRDRHRERIVVQVASLHGGCLTLAELVSDSTLTFDEAARVLRRLETKRLLTREIRDGVEVFVVDGLRQAAPEG